MAKFCGNCGTQNEDVAKVCGNCGTPLAAAEAAPVVEVAAQPDKQAQLKKQVILIGAGAGALVVVIYLIWLVLHLLSPRPVLDTYMDGFFKCDGKKMAETMTVYHADLYDENGMDLEETRENAAETHLDYLEEEVGNKPNYSFKVEDEYSLDEKKYDDLFGDNYEDFMEENDFTEVYVYEVEITAEKKGDDETIDAKIYMVKEKGSWKFWSWTVKH